MAEKFTKQDLDRLQREIQLKLDWGEAASWHSSMFDELSEKVFESTQIMLSVPTLKRFFGVVNHKGAPSITTLDALSAFVGKENWRVFKLAEPPSRRRGIRKPRKSIYVTIGFILAIVTISLVGNKRPELVINSSEFSFSSKVLSKEFPNSVVFDFEIPTTLRADSLKIQQYWDPTKTINISKDQRQATGIYFYPGYFHAKLLVDDQVAKEHDLFLKSEGWLGLLEYQPVPKYFKPLVNESAIVFPESIIEEVRQSENPLVSTFHFIDDLGDVSGDNFTFSTTVQNTFAERWAVCQTLRIYFLGTDGAFVIPFSKIGCSSDNNLMLNDQYIRGKENDLSPLSADFAKPVKLSILVDNQTVSIIIDGKEVYTRSYQETMGKLVGMRYKFHGLGEVLDFQVLDQNKSVVSF